MLHSSSKWAGAGFDWLFWIYPTLNLSPQAAGTQGDKNEDPPHRVPALSLDSVSYQQWDLGQIAHLLKLQPPICEMETMGTEGKYVFAQSLVGGEHWGNVSPSNQRRKESVLPHFRMASKLAPQTKALSLSFQGSSNFKRSVPRPCENSHFSGCTHWHHVWGYGPWLDNNNGGVYEVPLW